MKKDNKDYSIIIPSYNESENVRILIKEIYKKYPGFPVFVIDDSTKLENRKIKTSLKNYKNVQLISRLKKSGRGSAVLLGFKTALSNKSLKYFIEMDSDLAHNPEEISRFLDKLKEKKYDLIIGSRYLPGGKIKNISKNRTILSRVINEFLKVWLGVKVTDFTSGFRLYSRSAIEYLVNTKIESKGFITLSETLFKLQKKGFTIGEVPITWNYRIYGKSNVNIIELFTSLYFVFLIRFNYLLDNPK